MHGPEGGALREFRSREPSARPEIAMTSSHRDSRPPSLRGFGEIRIQSDGSPWRPLIHCRDIARAFTAFMSAPANVVCNKAVNIGANDENYQVRDVADEVRALMPQARITYTGEVGNDPRSYRVRFDRLYSLLPDFRLEYTLAAGMAELHRRMTEHEFSVADFQSDRFVRLRTLKKRMHRLRGAAAALGAVRSAAKTPAR